MLSIGLFVKKPIAPKISPPAQRIPATKIGIGRPKAQIGKRGRVIIKDPITPKIAPEAPREAS